MESSVPECTVVSRIAATNMSDDLWLTSELQPHLYALFGLSLNTSNVLYKEEENAVWNSVDCKWNH